MTVERGTHHLMHVCARRAWLHAACARALVLTSATTSSDADAVEGRLPHEAVMLASPSDSAHIRVPPVPPAAETTVASLDEKLAYPLTTYADEGASLR